MVVNSLLFKKRHGIPSSQGLSLKEIAKLSGMPIKALTEVKKNIMQRLAQILHRLEKVYHYPSSGHTVDCTPSL
jgi:transcriptional regulator with XRE-family HTH domain